jgi:hypothetical protein
LVLALSFDETTGVTARDASPAANHGTLRGGTWTTAGRHRGGVVFDGVDDWVTVPDADSLDVRTALTLMAWVRPRVVGTWDTVLMKEASGTLAYSLYGANASRRVSTELGPFEVASTTTLATNTWTHVAVTYDGSTTRLYLNGVQRVSRSGVRSIPATANPLRIGGNAVWNNEWFDGTLDELRVYSRALTAADVLADMNAGIASTPSAAKTGRATSRRPGRLKPAARRVCKRLWWHRGRPKPKPPTDCVKPRRRSARD